MAQNDLTVENKSNYLTVSRVLGKESKLHAEYNIINGNLRVYVYNKDVIVRAFYDDDNDGTVETLFVNNSPNHRKDTKRRSFFFFKSEETKELEKMFSEADKDFEDYKSVLNLTYLIAQLKATN
ncbi:hypothetical protein HZA97_04830 [Candidatus Woesearchaeota archaeon]|nr:hypothetical protein [Candidatus Woesearchaeota archaeon]